MSINVHIYVFEFNPVDNATSIKQIGKSFLLWAGSKRV